jgi:hypothetical protein
LVFEAVWIKRTLRPSQRGQAVNDQASWNQSVEFKLLKQPLFFRGRTEGRLGGDDAYHLPARSLQIYQGLRLIVARCNTEHAGNKRMNLVQISQPQRPDLATHQLSYAAGSTSVDPQGYRLIGQRDGQRLPQLKSVFPSLADLIDPNSLIINAYPAALGLQGFAPLVDTYLHPPTLIRSLRLAARQSRAVVFAAQPLVGADLLLKAIDAGFELPTKMLWATGGYFFPQSLEKFISERLSDFGCETHFLHCYGVAEIGHTCFAATNRFSSGLPMYRKIVPDVEAYAGVNGFMTLSIEGRSIVTSDYIEPREGHWSIWNGASRLCPSVSSLLESWTSDSWSRRTGYLRSTKEGYAFQLRENVGSKNSDQEYRYHEFWDRFGGSVQSKPIWSTHKTRLVRNYDASSPDSITQVSC